MEDKYKKQCEAILKTLVDWLDCFEKDFLKTSEKFQELALKNGVDEELLDNLFKK